MPAVDLLKKMRDTYSKAEGAEPEDRAFELKEEESQGLQEGQEISAQITGVFKDGCIYPTEVKIAPPTMGADAMPVAQPPPGPMMVRNNVQQVPG